MSKEKYEMDMCSGPILHKLIVFTFPLMLSGVCQLLFHTIDIIVIGKFSGSQSLAAVGSTSSLINIFTNLFLGVSAGVNVCAARYFAIKNEDSISRTVHTAMLTALISGIFMSVTGILFSYPALKAMDSPDNIIGLSSLYIRIYFLGMPFFMLYNYGAAILRAIGDTRRPLFFLVISGIVNAFLNLILVIVFHLDVAGVAIATVISQMLSCILVIRCLCKARGAYHLSLAKLQIDRNYLGQILQIGLPAGIQSTIITFSNVLLQSSVNSFGPVAMAGYTGANNLINYQFLIVNSISQACMCFTSQNYGAGKLERINRIILECAALTLIVGSATGCITWFYGSHLLQIYTSDPDVIASGLAILATASTPYALFGLMDLLPGALRGMGHSTAPMILSLIGTVGVRIIWIFEVFPYCRTLSFLFISYPASWVVTILMQLICLFIVKKQISDTKPDPAAQAKD